MFNWFNNDKIEFYSLLPGLDKIAPVTNASSYRPSWTKSAAKAYKELNRKETVLKCPGVMKFFSIGYIIYNYCDIAITGSSDRENLSWEYAYEPMKDWSDKITFNYVESHDPHRLTNHMEPPIGGNRNLLKLNTPWRVKAPKDTIFLELPIFYGDEKRFSGAGGIMDPSQTNQINPALWWFANNDKPEIIKAGTPLVQYLPIKRKEYDLIVRQATDEEVTIDKVFSMSHLLTFGTGSSNVKTRDQISRNILTK